MQVVARLDSVLAPEGWCFASSTPVDADDPGRFNALFGRDSLITALQLLNARPDVARATLRALAALQGTKDDPATDEEPGKIVHEFRPHGAERFAYMGWPVRNGKLRYYGSADSTSWFLVVLAALGDPALSRELEGSWRAAGLWLERALEHGGGFVRYGPRDGGGLAHQGWRDSTDPVHPQTDGSGIVREDGSLPQAPLADADTQAVALVALRALALLSGDAAHTAEAEALRSRIEGSFGPQTMAIEADGRKVLGAGSQQGWLLWAGVLGSAASAAAAERLCRPDVFSPFGLRTLASGHPQYRPTGYHRGAVWPFDSWLGWGGLRAAGREAEAERLRKGVLDALGRLGDPVECYAVGPDGPEPIPFACRVQAWTVGAAFALERRWDGRPRALFA
jgi:glycogen debranching enzyme